jgi:predicted nucleic acid-binding protein
MCVIVEKTGFPMVMIDTDIIIWILRGDADMKAMFEQVVIDSHGKVYVTPVQVAEIYAGMRESERTMTEEFFGPLCKIDLNEEIGKQAGTYINRYGKSHRVTLADALIAASSIYLKCPLWTLNKKHYPMMPEEKFLKTKMENIH